MGKTQENAKVRHNTTQMAGLLAVANGFVLWTISTLYSQRRGPHMRDKITKGAGAYARGGGGVIAEFYGINIMKTLKMLLSYIKLDHASIKSMVP